MPAPLTRKQLDSMQCGVPDCDHASHDGPMVLNPACHVGKPTTCSYQNGVLSVRCSVCDKLVGQILVAMGRVNEAPSEWSRPPESFDTGPCADCGGSIEPDVVQFHVTTSAYEGDFVVVAYQVEGVRKLMINGRVFSWDAIGDVKDYAYELLGSEHADGIMAEALTRLAAGSHVHEPALGETH